MTDLERVEKLYRALGILHGVDGALMDHGLASVAVRIQDVYAIVSKEIRELKADMLGEPYPEEDQEKSNGE